MTAMTPAQAQTVARIFAVAESMGPVGEALELGIQSMSVHPHSGALTIKTSHNELRSEQTAFIVNPDGQITYHAAGLPAAIYQAGWSS